MKSLFKDVNILHWRMKYGALPNITRPGHFLTSQGLNHYSILNSKSTPGACSQVFWSSFDTSVFQMHSTDLCK